MKKTIAIQYINAIRTLNGLSLGLSGLLGTFEDSQLDTSVQVLAEVFCELFGITGTHFTNREISYVVDILLSFDARADEEIYKHLLNIKNKKFTF